jgi:glycosyltransferase involved in cell wall biosynthesis
MTGNPVQSSASKEITTDHLVYVLITPARNEAKFIEETIKSVIAQTVKPAKWVIVSDGSTDGTDEIVLRYASQHPWIELVRVPERCERHFAGKVDAFNAGYARVKNWDYHVIGNLDGDVSFDEGYIAFLLTKFVENPNLGVTGTPYREENAQHDEQFKSLDHVSGACQLFRRECFEEIGGYPSIRSGGIDLIALLAAQAKGWQTRRFDEKVCLHHRTVGSGMEAGTIRRLLKRGEKDYLLGSHPVFEIFRSLNQMKIEPYVLGGLLMLAGYYWAMVRRVNRTMPEDLMRIRRDDQLRRLKNVLCHSWKRTDEKNVPADR